MSLYKGVAISAKNRYSVTTGADPLQHKELRRYNTPLQVLYL
jgi:hypothetical protein